MVPGPNDVIALEALGAPAVGLCDTAVSTEQAEKLGAFSREIGCVVTVMFDCTEEGDLAGRLAIVELAERCPVRLAWSPRLHGGIFKGRKIDSLTCVDWEAIYGSILGVKSAK